MQKTELKKSSSGLSLIETLIGTTMIVVGVVGLATFLTSTKFQEMRADHNTLVSQVLLNVSASILNMGFSDVSAMCSLQGALGTTSVGTCRDAAKTSLSATAVYDPFHPSLVGVRRDWSGEYKADGPVCVDVLSCMPRASGHALDIQVAAYWIDAGTTKVLVTNTMQFRKGK